MLLIVRHTALILRVCICVSVQNTHSLSLSVCLCVVCTFVLFICSRFACSSFSLNFNINNNTIHFFSVCFNIFATPRMKTTTTKISHTLQSSCIPFYFLIIISFSSSAWFAVCVCVYFTCAAECSIHLYIFTSPFHPPPAFSHGIDFQWNKSVLLSFMQIYTTKIK